MLVNRRAAFEHLIRQYTHLYTDMERRTVGEVSFLTIQQNEPGQGLNSDHNKSRQRLSLMFTFFLISARYKQNKMPASTCRQRGPVAIFFPLHDVVLSLWTHLYVVYPDPVRHSEGSSSHQSFQSRTQLCFIGWNNGILRREFLRSDSTR